MSDIMRAMSDRARQAHEQQVAAGEHDTQCEFRGDGFFLCHCSKRQREKEGYTEPPGELIWQDPICPRCDGEVQLNGTSWMCSPCRVVWGRNGLEAEFFDEYGDDLRSEVAKWDAHYGEIRTF